MNLCQIILASIRRVVGEHFLIKCESGRFDITASVLHVSAH